MGDPSQADMFCMPYGGGLPFGKWPLAGIYARLMMENGLLYWLLQDGGKSFIASAFRGTVRWNK